ncbi:hypothetical protein [Nisaea nitritireducens]|uniref:hypothetical protein n=1 Tax=Nisaea nitritireducens TaxID=568392 RepID=UPI00186816A4|nr:hypothetical protein [Nisaea nitritireducens]
MSIRYWLYAIALGGCLISGPLRAQEKDSSASPSPQVEKQPLGKADDHPALPDPLALPVRIIQSEEEVAHERKRESSSDEYKAAGLEAQERSAEAAEKSAQAADWQIYLTGVQAIFALIGTAGLIFALCLSHKANKAALRAAKAAEETAAITQNTAKKQLQAYVSLAPAGFIYDKYTQKPIIRVEQSNTGQTPARNVRAWGMVDALDYPLPPDFVFPEPEFGDAVNTVNPGQRFYIPYEYKTSVPAGDIKSTTIIAANRETSKRFYFIGVVEYDDIYGETRRRTQACWSIKIQDADMKESRWGTIIETPFDFTGDHNDAD